MSHLDRSIAPPVADFSDIKLSELKTERLANGVELNIINYGEQALSRLSLIWEGGNLDTPTRSLPLFVTEALRERSAKLSGAEIADIIDFNGARLSSRCADHYSGMEIIALNSCMQTLLPMLQEIILRPDFDEATIEMIGRKAAARRAVQEAKVAYAASMRTIQAIAGEKHPSALLETPDMIKAIKADDVRHTYNNVIGRGHLRAYLAGRLSDEDINLVRKFLEEMPKPTGQSIINIQAHRPQAPGRFFVERPESRQSAISMGLPTIGREHPDYIDLRLAIIALGGYFSSRLMSNIREEKGLTYGIGSSLMGSREGAYMSVDAQCDASYVDQVIEETQKEIHALQTNPVSGEELRRVKQHAWTSLANTADSSFATMDHYITSLLVNTPHDYFARQLSAIEQLTAERISEMARLYLNPEDLRISISGVQLS